MKLGKKTIMAVSLALGVMMFATTAAAEIISKSGYDELKDSVKVTATNVSEKLNNFTVDVSLSLKYDNEVLNSEKSTIKYDNVKKAQLEEGFYSRDGIDKNLWYRDKNGTVSYNHVDNVYYVTEEKSDIKVLIDNPFKESLAEDMEKIVDAVVGNLKDSVIISKNADGSKELSGKLTETQIPALINALASFQFKSMSSQERWSYLGLSKDVLPITKDIFVNEVSGKMSVDKNNIIQNASGYGTISGKDEKGVEHTFTVDFAFKLSDINNTTVNKPDLNGKKVEINKVPDTLQNDFKAFVGKYKEDLITIKDGKFIKIGEAYVTIDSVDNNSIKGSYYEVYREGYENYDTKTKFTFNTSIDPNGKGGDFNIQYTVNGASKSTNMYLDEYLGGIHLYIDRGRQNSEIRSNGTFLRIFE